MRLYRAIRRRGPRRGSASALSSLVPSASASSLTRIWRALESMRFSPALRPRSLSRRQRSRTTSPTLLMSPRGELLEVGLVAARPVGRLLHGRGPQDLEHLVEAGLPDDVADADDLGVVGRDPDGQVALGDLEDEVDLVLALDGAGLDGLDQCCAVVRVDDGLADCERHVWDAPLAGPQTNTRSPGSPRRLRRSEGMRAPPGALTRAPSDVLSGGPGGGLRPWTGAPRPVPGRPPRPARAGPGRRVGAGQGRRGAAPRAAGPGPQQPPAAARPRPLRPRARRPAGRASCCWSSCCSRPCRSSCGPPSTAAGRPSRSPPRPAAPGSVGGCCPTPGCSRPAGPLAARDTARPGVLVLVPDRCGCDPAVEQARRAGPGVHPQRPPRHRRAGRGRRRRGRPAAPAGRPRPGPVAPPTRAASSPTPTRRGGDGRGPRARRGRAATCCATSGDGQRLEARLSVLQPRA